MVSRAPAFPSPWRTSRRTPSPANATKSRSARGTSRTNARGIAAKTSASAAISEGGSPPAPEVISLHAQGVHRVRGPGATRGKIAGGECHREEQDRHHAISERIPRSSLEEEIREQSREK